MRYTLWGLLILFSTGVMAAPPMASNHTERSMHMLKAMPAGPVGRYQLVRLMDGDRDHTAVMVLDTANGHLWEWREAPGTKGSARAAIIYMGKVEPGTQPGEIVDSYSVPGR